MAMVQSCDFFKEEIGNARRRTKINVYLGHLSDSGDLIHAYSYMTIDSPSLKAKAQQKHNKCSTKVSGNLQI